MQTAVNTKNKNVNLLYSRMTPGEYAVYEPIFSFLLSLGYRPLRQRAKNGRSISYCFKHPAHGRQIAKAAVREEKQQIEFSLRFSACESYPPKLAAILRDRFLAHSEKYQAPMCGTCGYCKGDTHVYSYVFQDGHTRTLCGTYTINLPGLTAQDLPDIRELIAKQDAYFMSYCLS